MGSTATMVFVTAGSVGAGTGTAGTGDEVGVDGVPGGSGGLVGNDASVGASVAIGAFVGCPGKAVGAGDGAAVPLVEPNRPAKKPTGFGVGDIDGAADGGGVGGATTCTSWV